MISLEAHHFVKVVFDVLHVAFFFAVEQVVVVSLIELVELVDLASLVGEIFVEASS